MNQRLTDHLRQLTHHESIGLRQLVRAHGRTPRYTPLEWPTYDELRHNPTRTAERLKKARHRAKKAAA